jgi:membrane-anchored protein YejM (alkaline phosphatase superfamily)
MIAPVQVQNTVDVVTEHKSTTRSIENRLSKGGMDTSSQHLHLHMLVILGIPQREWEKNRHDSCHLETVDGLLKRMTTAAFQFSDSAGYNYSRRSRETLDWPPGCCQVPCKDYF